MIRIASFIMVIFFMSINYSQAQDLSNGTIDFIFKANTDWLQIAVWLEDGSGTYIETAYLTKFIGRRGGGNRTSDPDIDLLDGNRLSALPIWAYKRGIIDTTFGINNYYPPAENQESYPDDIDAVSGATPKQDVQTKTWQLSHLPYGTYNCWIEVNRSYDKNDYHNYSDYRGQPSIAYNMTINVADTQDSSMILDYTGYGSPDGSDGTINAPHVTITTAANLLDDLGGYRFKAIYKSDALDVEAEIAGSSPVPLFVLGQNYPNPFNAITRITYSIPQSGHVILKIYNTLGQDIETLVKKFQAAGNHNVTFDAKVLSSGIYFYKLQADNPSKNPESDLIETKKMILMR